ncbi:TNF receptor-associated factor 2-like [Ptychodera flava]|uniref:TNF receptor-associated factor 2-like n=1 Tax=Ptychodera flava TaxID=63121 RepID=UPI003969D292
MASCSSGAVHSMLQSKYICSECRDIVRTPVQTGCGHRFCNSCLEKVISKYPRPHCKVCLEDENIQDIFLSKEKALLDRGAIRDLSEIRIVCNKFPQCEWHGSYQEYHQIHADCCPFKEVVCLNEGCDKTMNRNDLTYHLHNHCEMRKQQQPLRRPIHATDNGWNSNWWQVHLCSDTNICDFT